MRTEHEVPRAAEEASPLPAALARMRVPWKTRMLDGEAGGYLLLAPVVIVLLALGIWPLLYSLGISLTDFHLSSDAPIHFVGLRNYGDLFADDLFTGSLITTAKFIGLAVPAQLVLGYLCARILRGARGLPGARLLRTLYIIPTMLTPLATGLFWSYILQPVLGIVNYLFSLVNLPPQQWLADTTAALPTLVCLYLWQSVPLTALLLLAGLLGIPHDLYEAAEMDGAQWYARMLFLEIPLVARVAMIGAVLATVDVIQLFPLIFATTQGGPGSTTLTASVEIFRMGFENFETGYAAAASLVILIITNVIAMFYVRLIREGERGGA